MLPSKCDPSELKKAKRPGTSLPHVSYTALARPAKKSFAVITPTNSKLFCEFNIVLSGVRPIISSGAIQINKNIISYE